MIIRLACNTDNQVPLMRTGAAVQRALREHMDVSTLVTNGIMCLRNLSCHTDNLKALLPMVPTVRDCPPKETCRTTLHPVCPPMRVSPPFADTGAPFVLFSCR